MVRARGRYSNDACALQGRCPGGDGYGGGPDAGDIFRSDPDLAACQTRQAEITRGHRSATFGAVTRGCDGGRDLARLPTRRLVWFVRPQRHGPGFGATA